MIAAPPLVAVRRADVDPVAWDAFVDAHPNGWFFHTSRWIAYALAYTPGAVDRSRALLAEDGALVGVVPYLQGPDGTAVHGGQPTPAALVVGVGPDAMRRPWPWVYHGDTCLIGRPGQSPPLATYGATSWSTSVVNLQHDEAHLWHGLRKSYRSLIHAAERRYRIDLYGASQFADTRAVDLAHVLHATAAGRETRSQATWDAMGEWLLSGHALLAVATVAISHARGYAYAIRYKDWSYYASGACLEQNLSHALIWSLMLGLRGDGRTHYFEAGWLDKDGDTDKDRGISHFKAGFGGIPWTIHGVRYV